MQLHREYGHWQAWCWWLAVLVVVLALKYYYSIATVVELDWMLRPLTFILESVTGHSFQRDINSEWVSVSANVRLVKACAGMNFMLMSFTAYAWVFRTDDRIESDTLSWFVGRILLLFAAIIAAWITCLLANSLRIIVAMAVNYPGSEVHRLIGMMIYVPLLSLQLALGDRGNYRAVIAGPILMYLLLMVVIPILTGNAFQQPALFFEHLLYVSSLIVVMCSFYYVLTASPLLLSLQKCLRNGSRRFLVIKKIT